MDRDTIREKTLQSVRAMIGPNFETWKEAFKNAFETVEVEALAESVQECQTRAMQTFDGVMAEIQEDYATGWKDARNAAEAYKCLIRRIEQAKVDIKEFCDFDPFDGIAETKRTS